VSDPPRIDVRSAVPDSDVLLVTLDALRYDVAQAAFTAGETPHLASLLPAAGWTRCHAPGSFTYPSHQAMFAGFLPTPVRASRRPRLFALSGDAGTVDRRTLVLEAPNIVEGLRALGYRTVCIGGVGFFNKKNALGRVLPSLFEESHWSREFGVTEKDSARHQVALAELVLERQDAAQPLFLFLNVSALHPPTHFYVDGARRDSVATQRAALAAVDREVGRLRDALTTRCRRTGRRCLAILCSDHGTAFGDDGFVGHRLGHPAVWEVPYLETVLGQQ
jgi:hypothetical protein